MNHSAFRAVALLFSFWLAVSSVSAATCSRTSAQQDAWVALKVNALVCAARTAYGRDPVPRGYGRVVDEIAGTIKQCRMADDSDFAGRYPEFVNYVNLLSLARKDDHELGFEVTDQVYFAETSAYTTIPDFLLTPRTHWSRRNRLDR